MSTRGPGHGSPGASSAADEVSDIPPCRLYVTLHWTDVPTDVCRAGFSGRHAKLGRLVTRTGVLSSQQGRRHEFLLGGRIDRHPNPPTQKNSFSSDFGHFVLKMLGNAKNSIISSKKLLKYPYLCGVDPRGFQKCRGTDPPPPVCGAPASR